MFCIMKLISREEIICNLKETRDDVYEIENPHVVQQLIDANGMGSIKMTDWLTFSKDKCVEIDRESVMHIYYGIRDFALNYYLKLLDQVEPMMRENLDKIDESVKEELDMNLAIFESKKIDKKN